VLTVMAKRFSTSTVRADGAIVPWLAADGPLAYSPENPPESNYFFQYSWLMPRLYCDKRHYYFGKPSSLSRRGSGWGIEPLVDFWSKARAGEVARIHVVTGGRCDGGFTAPIACYRYRTGWDNRDTYLLIQHGSYIHFNVAEQPLINDGLLVLFRGVEKNRAFRWQTLEDLSTNQDRTLQHYFEVHQKAFSDAVVSFQVAHALVCRCETGFLHCELCWTDIARESQFEKEQGSLAHWLKSVSRQSFTLVRRMAEWKFGPNYVICTTPISNVRITSFFAGECEVNVIDPRKVEIKTPRVSNSTFACEQRAGGAQ
jgi:hypothetical protein